MMNRSLPRTRSERKRAEISSFVKPTLFDVPVSNNGARVRSHELQAKRRRWGMKGREGGSVLLSTLVDVYFTMGEARRLILPLSRPSFFAFTCVAIS
jgi:hypothetical protein